MNLPDTPSDRTEGVLLEQRDLASLAEDWDLLAARSLEPNAFHTRWATEARLRHLPGGPEARILAAFRGEGEGRSLVGLLPLVRPRGRRFNPLPLLRAPELYAPLSTPLMDPERPAETWAAMLAGLTKAGIAALALPETARDGPVAAALRDAARVGQHPVATFGSHHRAILKSPLPGAAYLQATLEKRRRKEFDRQRRRLAEMGHVDVEIASGRGDVAAALECFLVLESSGWKGRAGTDLVRAPGAAAYFKAAAAAAPPGAFRIVSLLLDGKPIAAGIVMVAGRRAVYVKTAYEEALARYSPGVLLTLDLTLHLLDDPAIDEADSVADADHPMIDRIWTERLAVASLLVGTRAGGSLAFRAALAVETGRERAITAAKVGLAKVRRRAKPAN